MSDFDKLTTQTGILYFIISKHLISFLWEMPAIRRLWGKINAMFLGQFGVVLALFTHWFVDYLSAPVVVFLSTIVVIEATFTFLKAIRGFICLFTGYCICLSNNCDCPCHK